MEPLIDPELWEAVQRTFGTSGERRGKPSERFLLSHGLLRCGSCGSAMRVFHRGPHDHYACEGRSSGAIKCEQVGVRRDPIDSAVFEYFRTIALDVEGTIAQLAGERDRRLADVESRLAQARTVQRDAMRQQERLDALLREGLTLDEWRRLSEVPEREGSAAAAALHDLANERDVILETGDVIDATNEFTERIAALRAAVAGEIISAESIAATQAAIRQIFHGFVLHRVDSPHAPRRINAELAIVEAICWSRASVRTC